MTTFQYYNVMYIFTFKMFLLYSRDYIRRAACDKHILQCDRTTTLSVCRISDTRRVSRQKSENTLYENHETISIVRNTF